MCNKENLHCYLIAIVYLCIFICTGCATTRTKSAANGDVLAYQAEITRLEDTVASYQHAIGYTIEELGGIRECTTGIEGTVDEIINLFNEYQRRVELVLQRYRALQENIGGTDNSSDVAGPLHDN